MSILFTTLFNLIITIANFFLAPINTLVTSNFPDFSIRLNHFNSLVNTYLSTLLRYFFEILPTNTRSLVLFYLALLLLLYTLTLAIHGIVKLIELIKAIKIW